MKRLFGLILLSTVFATPQQVFAEETWKGMNIFRYCMGDTVLFTPAVCRAYNQGTVDAFHTARKYPAIKERICIPDEKAKREKGESQVTKWIDFFKDRRNEIPIDLIADALADIFPCKK